MEDHDSRTIEQKRKHFEVEHELRERLLKSTRAERTTLFGMMYDELFRRVPDHSVDLVFSYQFLEHLHPDDVAGHFDMVRRILKPGGAYIFDTPHAYTGPHDISVYFSETPQGFHFQEWTFGAMSRVLDRAGFSGWFVYRRGRPRFSWSVNFLTYAVEWLLGLLPRRLRKKLSRPLFASVTMLVRK